MIDTVFFLLPTKGRFLSAYENNELKNQADALWRHLDDLSEPALFISITIGVLAALIYYGPFNNRPGRHYLIRYWIVFAAIMFCVIGLAICGLEYWQVKTNLKTGILPLYIKCAFCCSIWGLLAYLVTSLIQCNFFGRYTNAYKFLKIK